MTTNEAKKIITEHLKKNSITFTKLTARTVDFTDLARDKKIFVKIHGWKPCPALIGIKNLAKEHGFCVETDWKF
jgi:hypothetical protein